ncbi:MAG: hypothetical protein PHN56_03035, partial [Candidatus Nanoarchaeia archaeon]|nr:hypothetical protein [Candidatus Nanoarchaeia archaeon]
SFYTNDFVYSGNTSVKLRLSENWNGYWLYSKNAIIPSSNVMITAMIKNPTSLSGFSNVQVDLYDALNNLIKTNWGIGINAISANSDWTKYSWNFSVNSSVHYIIVRMEEYSFAGTSNDWIYVDDVKMYNVKNITVVSGINSYQVTNETAISGWTNEPIISTGLNCFNNYSYNIKAKDNVNNEGAISLNSSLIYPISFLSGCNGANGFCVNSQKCYVPFNCTGFDCQFGNCNDAGINGNYCQVELCNSIGYSFVNYETVNGCDCTETGTCADGYCQEGDVCNYGLTCSNNPPYGWLKEGSCDAINTCLGDCAEGTCTYKLGVVCSEIGCGDGVNHNPDESSIYCTGCSQEWMGSACCGDDGAESFANEGVNNPCCYGGNSWSNYERTASLLCYNGLMYDCNDQVSDSFSLNSNTGDSKGDLTCSQNNTWTGVTESYSISSIETQSKIIYFESGTNAENGLSFNISNPSLEYQTYALELFYTQGYSHFSETKTNTMEITVAPKSTKTIYLDVYPTIVGEIMYTLSASNINNPDEYFVRQFSINIVMPIREETGEIIYSADELTIFDLIVSFLNKIFFR